MSVSLIGFGCTQVKDKKAYQRALELGINYYHMGDVDPAYNLEACQALRPFRHDLVITYMSHPKKTRNVL